jgi:predicted ATPase/DNA-binding SARP family transcriptional activator/Tfp pilus assembly protein PilF
MAEHALSLQVLGGFRLRDHGVPIAVPSKRVQALLTYLVLHRGIPQSRAHLAALFWPDSTDAQARTNLRKLVLEARRTLPHAEHCLRADGATLLWREDAPCAVDVVAFERAAIRKAALAALEQAAALYEGDLLPGCYDEWVLAERERLRQLYGTLLERLAVELEARQAYPAALRYALRLLDQDPLREETYRLLMRLHAIAGDRAAAVRVYHRCEATLRRELDVEPSPATREAYARVLHADTRLPEEVAAPPPSSAHNLPRHLTTFIGREQEIADVARVLSGARLLTLTGAAGCGKTRLALRVAADLVAAYPDGVWFVDLTPVADPALVARSVASVLGVREAPGQALVESLTAALRQRQLLLVLDNCEHLAEACGDLAAALLVACPGVRLLATSRQALKVPGELLWGVPPLALPNGGASLSPEALLAYDAIRLFVERAVAVQPAFRLGARNAAAVVEICRRLDGLPLAIELAAARMKVLTPQQIAARLDDRFRLLAGAGRTATTRHRTLEAALAWSHDLLSQQERCLLRRLSVFSGGWTLEAAEAVCAGEGIATGEVLDLLAELVDKSLVLVETQGGEARYRMLETVREYGQARLREAGETARVRARHLRWFVERAERIEPLLWGAEQAAWFDRLEREHDNLRAALEWSLDRDPPAGLRLAGAVWRFWKMRDHFAEGRRWAERVLAVAPDRTAARARLLGGAGYLAADQGDLTGARAFHEEGLAIFREVGDQRGAARALTDLGITAARGGDLAGARAFHEESLALYRALGDRRGTAYALNNLGLALADEEDCPAARAAFEESLSLFRDVGDPRGIAISLTNLGSVVYRQGDAASARRCLEESLSIKQELGEKRGLAVLLEEFAGLAASRGEAERAARLYAAVEALADEIGARTPLSDFRAHHARCVASVRAVLGERRRASAWAEGRAMTLEQAIEYALGREAPAGALADGRQDTCGVPQGPSETPSILER